MAEKVCQQVGFDILLLDSKCFPTLENDTTAFIDFWNYYRNILAASKSLYTKLTDLLLTLRMLQVNYMMLRRMMISLLSL